MKLFSIPRTRLRGRASPSLPKGYGPWIVLSVLVLVGSLVLLAGDVVAVFVYFGEKTSPLWVTILGALAVLGIVTGFGGFLLLMVFAGWQTWRESRKVQVISPRS